MASCWRSCRNVQHAARCLPLRNQDEWRPHRSFLLLGGVMKIESEFPTEYIELQIAARNIADCSLLVYYATDEAAQLRHKLELQHHLKRFKKIMEELECQG